MSKLPTTADRRRARQPRRGREAATPLAIPNRGLKDVLWRVHGCIDEERLGLIAAGVTFYVILALFPALTALVSVYGLLTDPRSIAEQVTNLYGVLPDDVIGMIRDQLNSLTQAGQAKLGLGFVVSLLVALWSVNNAVKAVFDGLNVTYREKEKRGFVQMNVISFSFAMGGILLAMVYLIAIAVVPIVLNLVGVSAGAEILIKLLRWPILLVMSGVAIALLNRYGPSRARAKWRWVTPGSIFVMIAWVGMSSLFSIYLENFAHYDKTYGSLGAAIGVMVWVWASTYILLVGSALNAELEHQTAVDTTARPVKPMGKRGAVVADSVGE